MSNAHFGPRFSIPDEETRKVFPLPEIPWEKIVGRLEKIALEIKSFDARLEASGLSAGWQSRCDMNEAVRSLLLDGHLVDIGDLVLHDAGMDVRSPTHELTRAASALKGATDCNGQEGALADFLRRFGGSARDWAGETR